MSERSRALFAQRGYPERSFDFLDSLTALQNDVSAARGANGEPEDDQMMANDVGPMGGKGAARGEKHDTRQSQSTTGAKDLERKSTEPPNFSPAKRGSSESSDVNPAHDTIEAADPIVERQTAASTSSKLSNVTTPAETIPLASEERGVRQGAQKRTSNRLRPVPPPPALPQPDPDSPRLAAVGRTSSRAKRKHPASIRGAEDIASEPEIEIIDEPTPPPQKRKKTVQFDVPPKATKSRPKAGATATKAGKGAPRKKKMSLEEALRDLDKVAKKAGDLYKTYPDISSLVRHLEQFNPTTAPRESLKKCRIAFVNPHLRDAHSQLNSMDVSLPLLMRNAAKFGAALDAPEDFKAAPPDFVWSVSSAQQALDEEWTSHVIPVELPGVPMPSYDAVLSCLGSQGLSRDEIGPYVHIVSKQWLSLCIVTRGPNPPPESQFALPDDPRYAPSETRINVRPSRGKDDQGKKKATSYSDSDEEDEASGIDDIPVSPFGSQDIPPADRQPDLMTDAEPPASPLRRNSDKHPEQNSEGSTKIEGLEEELDYVRELGLEAFDREMEYIDRLVREEASAFDPNDATILSTRNKNDFETDEESSHPGSSISPTKQYEGYGSRQKRNGKYKFFKQRDGGPTYACDRASTGGVHEPSPNEDIAKVVSLRNPEEAIESLTSLEPTKLDRLVRHYAGDQWRERGYKNAASALRNVPYRADTFQAAKEIDGVGDKIAMRIVEISRFGTTVQLERASPESKVLDAFYGIYGVGRRLSEQFYQEGARSIQDLRDDPDKYGLTACQRLGLEYYDELQERIPRDEVAVLYEHAKKAARAIDPQLQVFCMGSFRRGQPDCGDIDLLVTRDPLDGKTHRGMIKQLWTNMEQAGVARHVLTAPDDWSDLDAKVNALCALPGGKMRRLDILGVPFDELPAALIYFTGNSYFNRSMRLKARHLGYRLNQRGLYKDVSRARDGTKLTEGQKIDCKTEDEIFKILGVPWRPPEQRLP